ncbi:hypothetical protein AQUCO_01100042v1 [Aquilegia coerulea]|uniref:Uncharacterized protein n=1 Tax=Aquilegia coerulea TaxID=218851 RepID=A0A2G5E5E8_AQUCA|nr:hypothetical protein AQUCO_01100042v1 [Aquilegia coerulea]
MDVSKSESDLEIEAAQWKKTCQKCQGAAFAWNLFQDVEVKRTGISPEISEDMNNCHDLPKKETGKEEEHEDVDCDDLESTEKKYDLLEPAKRKRKDIPK